MNKILSTALLTLTLLGFCFSCSPKSSSQPVSEVQKVGVYDSRSIAAAYANSPRHEAEVKAALAKLDVSDEEDADAMLDDEQHGHVQAAHDRAYLKEPVDDILAHIEGRLPEIMKSEGVTAIVSKWDEKGMKKYAGAEQVNVTMALVDALDPTEEQRESAVAIQERE